MLAVESQNGQQETTTTPSGLIQQQHHQWKKPAIGLCPRLSYNDFDIIEQVGEGTYGRVFKARNKHTNKLTALKIVIPTDEDEGLPFTAVREIKYLQTLSDNPNVIKLEGTFFSPEGNLVLAFEYMENDLSGLLSLKNLQFTPAQTKCLFKQMLEGLHQCHRTGIMHRDIKAANLLLNQGQLKLADFGLASNYVRRRAFSTNVVTLWYRAPELLLGQSSYGPKVDIWSAGCLFIELLTRQSPFPGKDEKNQLDLIVKTCGTPDESNWPGVSKLEGYPMLNSLKGQQNRLSERFGKFDPRALDLLSKMLALDPAKRPTASEALDHDYFWSDPLPCKASELPHYPAMHEYEAKKTRQSERAPKRPKAATYTAPTAQVPPLRAQAYGGPHLPPLQPPRADYPPQYGQAYMPKAGHYGHGNSYRPSGPPPAPHWPPHSLNRHPSDGLLPTPSTRPHDYPPAAHYDHSRSSRHPASGVPPPRPHHVQRPAPSSEIPPRSASHSHSRSSGHDRRPDHASVSHGMSRQTNGHNPQRNGEYRHPEHHRPMHGAVPSSSSAGHAPHDMPMATTYNRPPAGAHRPHSHAITESHASASYHVHMSHARATHLNSAERMEVALDTAGKRKREAAPF